jgi:hypothetical protein
MVRFAVAVWGLGAVFFTKQAWWGFYVTESFAIFKAIVGQWLDFL